MQVVPIYSEGQFKGNWRENSNGCEVCLHDDPDAARAGSNSSFSMKVAERGMLRLTSFASYPSDRQVQAYC